MNSNSPTREESYALGRAAFFAGRPRDPRCFGAWLEGWDAAEFGAQPPTTERAQFEAWYLRDHFDVNTSAASLAWKAWQARAVIAKATAA